jgi:Zn-dependent protease with chaperone function
MPSLLLRAVVAVALLVFFFAFALGSAAGLLWAGYHFAIFSANHLRGQILFLAIIAALACMGSGALILWSLLPRFDKFEAPGPELQSGDQPALFAEIARIARLTGQAPPAHVYLVPQVNAFVTERGGLMGLGSKRVMGIGLPLLSVLTVAELRAVLVHEFGHFFGGDTKLGPWIYATRGALGRTVENLGSARGLLGDDRFSMTAGAVLAVVMAPFGFLGGLLMRVTEAISRAQELSADALAVRTSGAQPVVTSLKKVHEASLAFGAYFEDEVVPLLRAGRLPPLAAGFQTFIKADSPAEQLAKAMREELAHAEADPYDSHPPLKERVAHAEALQAAPVEDDPRPATALLRDLPALEARLAARWDEKAKLTPVTWEESAAAFAPAWKEARAAAAKALPGVCPPDLPRGAPGIKALANQIVGPVDASEEELRGWALGLLTGALSDLLLENGFTAQSLPGSPVRFTRGEQSLEPLLLLRSYLKNELSAEDWRARWTELGLAEKTL